MIDVQLGLGIRPRIERWRARSKPRKVSDEVLEVREVTRLLRMPEAALVGGVAPDQPMRISFVVPPGPKGSGGHMTIANVIRGLERSGHVVSIWLDDIGGRHADDPEASAHFKEWFGPFAAEVRWGLGDWQGADVVVATGWQTVFRARTLPNTAARAYFVQDHEVEFFPTSYQSHFAEESYRHGLYPITAGRWLSQLMSERYAQDASWFELGIDSSLYRPVPGVERRDDLVVFYGRGNTPRRAVPVVLSALAELKRRRPQVELCSYGEQWMQPIDVAVDNRGVLHQSELPALYSEATVGLVLSMTNYSLVAQEMLACGLPCVELDHPSTSAAFSEHPEAIDLVPLDPIAIADTLERLLDDPELRRRRAAAGAAMVATRTWDLAARRVEDGLREALRRAAGS
jgi:glycosyltransferase involved in cell wall biosynthesis